MPKKTNSKTKDAQNQQNFDWKSLVSGFTSMFIRSVTDPLFEKLNEILANVVKSVQKGFAGIFLMLLGLIFVMVGLAIFINDLIAISNGLGYGIIGMAAFLTGYIIIKK